MIDLMSQAHLSQSLTTKVHIYSTTFKRIIRPNFILEDAMACVQHHLNRNDQEVILARISSRFLEPGHLEIVFSNITVYLSIWKDREGTKFVSTSDLRRYLHSAPSGGQLSEWLALNYIPSGRIVENQAFP